MTMMRVEPFSLNLRNRPHGTILATLPFGLPVAVLGDANTAGWKHVEVEIEGGTQCGVVSARFLRPSESDAKEALLGNAVGEWRRFDRGQGKEFEEPFFRFVGEMWQGLGMNLDGRDRDVPWSAAFISFIVRRAGLDYEGFVFAAAHARYIHDSIVNRQNGHDSPFWGFRITEEPPQLGDLVCQWRLQKRDFDFAAQNRHFFSHCDVVVRLSDDHITTIGGNVNQSVSTKRYNLNAGGRLKDEKKVIALLKNRR